MKMMNARVHQVGRRLGQLSLAVGAALVALSAQATQKVGDLPGGPAVNQLNLHKPVTKIAADQMWLHNFML
ncbi:MAG TPA: cytochrome c oxidase subunit II, partial [Burkholderiaceae bacterium]